MPVICKEIHKVLQWIDTQIIICTVDNVLNIKHLSFLNSQNNKNLKIKYPCKFMSKYIKVQRN